MQRKRTGTKAICTTTGIRRASCHCATCGGVWGREARAIYAANHRDIGQLLSLLRRVAVARRREVVSADWSDVYGIAKWRGDLLDMALGFLGESARVEIEEALERPGGLAKVKVP